MATEAGEDSLQDVGMPYSMTCGQRQPDTQELSDPPSLPAATTASPRDQGMDTEPPSQSLITRESDGHRSSDSDQLLIDTDGEARWDTVPRRHQRKRKKTSAAYNGASSSEGEL